MPQIYEDLRLSDAGLGFDPEALRHLIRYYTQEAGVRQLDRHLQTVARKYILALQEKSPLTAKLKKGWHSLETEDLPRLLGVPPFIDSYNAHGRDYPPGVGCGLAYTETGGDILVIESQLAPQRKGHGNVLNQDLYLTGRLGKVMQESAQTAYSYLLSQFHNLGLDWAVLEQRTLHIHLPDGGTPKDGPSAGVALLLIMVSLLKQQSLPRDLAMTGEISLRGEVLAVGGIKEKLLAAHRYRKKKVILPQANVFELEDVPAEVLEQLEIFPVRHICQALVVAGLHLTTQVHDVR